MFSEVSDIKLGKTNTWHTIVLAEEFTVGASASGEGYGAILPLTDRDGKYLIVVINTSSSTPSVVKIKAGNGMQATTFEPTLTLGPSSKAIIQIESGYFKYVKDEGEMKVESPETSIVGKVFLTSSTSSVVVKLIHMVM